MQFSTENDDLAFATPRAWEMVSNILNYVSDDVGAVYPLISGCIGGGAEQRPTKPPAGKIKTAPYRRMGRFSEALRTWVK